MNEPVKTWWLYRVDDNGNEILVERFASREAADQAKRRFEACGHKQAWFVRASG